MNRPNMLPFIVASVMTMISIGFLAWNDLSRPEPACQSINAASVGLGK